MASSNVPQARLVPCLIVRSRPKIRFDRMTPGGPERSRKGFLVYGPDGEFHGRMFPLEARKFCRRHGWEFAVVTQEANHAQERSD